MMNPEEAPETVTNGQTRQVQPQSGQAASRQTRPKEGKNFFLYFLFCLKASLLESPRVASTGEKELADSPPLRQEGVRGKIGLLVVDCRRSCQFWSTIDYIGISILKCDFTEM